MALAVPALAVPLDNAGLAVRNATLPEGPGDEDCDEDDGDDGDVSTIFPLLLFPYLCISNSTDVPECHFRT